MMANPMAVAMAIFWNSERGQKQIHVKKHNEISSRIARSSGLKVASWIKMKPPPAQQRLGQMKEKECESTFSVGFCASLDEPYGVFDELPAGLNELHYLIHGV